MKKLVVVILTFALFAALSGFAQTSKPSVLRAKIPFPFVANGIDLPPGSYEFQFASGQFDPILVRGINNPHAQFAQIKSSTDQTGAAKVVFRVLGGEYFLTEVHHPAQGSRTLVKSLRERDQQYASVRIVEIAGY